MENGGIFDVTIENIKKEREDDFFIDEAADEEEDVMIHGESPSLDHQDKEEVPMKACQSKPALSKVNLLNKPPRLGLSKLYRSSTSLHDVSIIERVDRKKTPRDLFIIEKEE